MPGVYPRTLASQVVAIVPNDGADIPGGPVKGLYIGGAGNLVVTDIEGNTNTFIGLPVGRDLDVVVKRVLSTGTTATNILGYR